MQVFLCKERENRMNQKYLVLLSLSLLVSLCTLSACGGTPDSSAPSATLIPPATFTQSPSSTPSLTATPLPTNTPTLTPTPRLPVGAGIPLPVPGTIISAENIDQVIELARWGKGVITDAAYSPDGKLIAVASTLGVSIYSADNLNEILSFETEAKVNSLAFSPDGETIIAGLSNANLQLWKTADGSLIRSFDAETGGSITKAVFSPDGSVVAASSSSGNVTLWNILDGTLIRTINNPLGESVWNVFFSPDGKALFFASEDWKVRMVATDSGEAIKLFDGVYGGITSISRDGKILATYDSYYDQDARGIQFIAGNLVLWEIESGKKLQTIPCRDISNWLDSDVTGIAFSPDGKLVSAVGQDYVVKTWDIASGSLVATLNELQPQNGYSQSHFALSYSPDGQYLMVAGSRFVGVWNSANRELYVSAETNSDPVYDIDFSPTGQLLSSVSKPDVSLWQFPEGALLTQQEQIRTDGDAFFSPDGEKLITSKSDNTIQLWPVFETGTKQNFEFEWNIPGSDDGISGTIGSAIFSPDGQFFALVTKNTGKVELRRLSDGSVKKLMHMGTKLGSGGQLIFSPDGKYLIGSLNDIVCLFSLETGEALKSLRGGQNIALSPDGTHLAGAGKDKVVRLWTIPDAKILYELEEQPSTINTMAFSPDGKLLAIGATDGRVTIFLVSDGTLLRSWIAHSRSVRDILFTPDGKYLVSASFDGTIRIWGLKP